MIAELVCDDAKYDYRQVGLVDGEGAAVVHTGPKTQPWSGHLTGRGFLAMGNVLAGEKVVTAMAEACEACAEEELDEAGGTPEANRRPTAAT